MALGLEWVGFWISGVTEEEGQLKRMYWRLHDRVFS